MTNQEFQEYCKSDNLEQVKIGLTNPEVDPTAFNNYAIRAVSQNGHQEVVKLLLVDNRVEPSAMYNYAIRYASENGHIEVVKILLADERVIQKATELGQEEFYPSELKEMYIF